ncbi:MAG: hypothetical protein ACI8SE_001305 [Bacteroidia bacterium]|jgi:hypothetical protein
MAFFDAMVAELFLGPNYYDFPTGLYYTQILSRVLIASELVLGAAILVDKWVKKITVPALFGMLLLFTIHLFYEGLTSEKGFIEGNCGCFGDVLPMNNLESIIKNVVAMLAAGYVWLKYKPHQSMAVWIAPLVLGLVTFGTLTFGVKKYQENVNVEPITQDTITIDSLTQTVTLDTLPDTMMKSNIDNPKVVPDVERVNTQKIQTSDGIIPKLLSLGEMSDGNAMVLDKGEVVVCLFSMTCGHCQESYKEMCELSAFATLPTLYLVNYGADFEQKYFFNQAGNCKHPFIRTEDYTKFNRLLEGKGFPRILALKDGKIVQDWNIDTYTKQVFVNHFGIEETDKNADDGLNLKKKDDSFGDFEKQPWE